MEPNNLCSITSKLDHGLLLTDDSDLEQKVSAGGGVDLEKIYLIMTPTMFLLLMLRMTA